MIDQKLKDLFEKWNANLKCGKCWYYVRTFNNTIKGVTNVYSPTEENKCCVNIFLEDIRQKTFKEIDKLTGTTKTTYCEYNVIFKIVEHSDFSKQKGDEISKDYNSSIADDVIFPIWECLECNFDIDLCEFFDGGTGIVLNEEISPVISYLDDNWAGVQYKATIREYFS